MTKFQLHLHPDVFEIIKNGQKRVEMRLNDEKRKTMLPGDEIIFIKRFTEPKKIVAKITKRREFLKFSDLIDYYPMDLIYLKEYTKEQLLNELTRFYSAEEQDKYGVVALEFKIID